MAGTLPQSVHPAPSVQAWLKRQISVGGSFRARSPDPAQLSTLREPGAQDPTDPQAPQAAQTVGARSPRLCPMQTAAAIRSHRQGWGRGSPPPQGLGLGLAGGRSWRGPWSPAGHSPSLFPGPPSPPLTRGQVSWRALGRRPGSASCLAPYLMTADPWLSAPLVTAH